MKRTTFFLVFASGIFALMALWLGLGPASQPNNVSKSVSHAPHAACRSETIEDYGHPHGMSAATHDQDQFIEQSSLTAGMLSHPSCNVRIAYAKRLVMNDTFHAPGTVAWNLSRTVRVASPWDGIVEHLPLLSKDTAITSDFPLAKVLIASPAINEARAPQAMQRDDAIAATGNALRTYLPGESVTLRAPHAGLLTSVDVHEGQRVTAGQTLVSLNDLSTVWVEATIPQSLVGQIRPGTSLTVYGSAWPGRRWSGTVEALLTDADPSMRTQRVRIVLPNRDGNFQPGQFVQVAFAPVQRRSMLVVPDNALIAADMGMHVIVVLGDGHIRPMSVRTGYSANGYTEITAGLHEGERVVVSGQFPIDSKAMARNVPDHACDCQFAPKDVARKNACCVS
jgi:Cu(I)/Ag(I) efflux system membrane fusion protein